MKLAEKWHDQLPASAREGDWELRARRAEAEAAAAKLIAGWAPN